MFEQIKQLLTQADVRDSLRNTSGRNESVDVLVKAGEKRGLRLTTDAVARALNDLNPVRSRALNEQELLMVSGGMLPQISGTLCHTESCGGNHKTCCFNLPPF